MPEILTSRAILVAFSAGFVLHVISVNVSEYFRRKGDAKRQPNESTLTDESSPVTNELVILADNVAVCGIGHVHPAALLPANKGVDCSLDAHISNDRSWSRYRIYFSQSSPYSKFLSVLGLTAGRMRIFGLQCNNSNIS